MCRANCDGGRRCPSNRGERKRAYQRARYAAGKVAAEHAASFATPQVGSPPELSALGAMTRAERDEVIDAARSRVAAGQQAAHRALDAVVERLQRPDASDGYNDRYDPEELFSVTRNWFVGTHEDRIAYTEAVKEVGRDVSVAAQATYLNRIEDEGLADADFEEVARQHREHTAETEAEVARRIAEAEQAAVGGKTYGPKGLTITEALEADDAAHRQWRFGSGGQSDGAPEPEPLVPLDDYLRYLSHAAPSKYRWLTQDAGPEVLDTRINHPTHRYSDARADLAAYQAGRRLEDGAARRIEKMSNRRIELWDQTNAEEVARHTAVGGQTWEPSSVNTVTTAAHRKTLAEAVSKFPDSMVAEAKERLPNLHYRFTKRRAHFSQSARVKRSVKEHRFVSFTVGDNGRAESIRYQDTPTGVYADTPEDRAYLEAEVEKFNTGQYGGLTRSRSTGKNRQLVVHSYTDEMGQKLITMRTKNPQSAVIYGIQPEITTNGSLSTTVHEVAHAMDLSPQVAMATNTFLSERTRDLERTVYNVSKKSGTEYVTADGFANRYVGKHYDDAHTEVFSMGMEGLFARSSGGMRGLGDPAPAYLSGSDSQVKFQESEVFDAEHRDLIFGLLASHRTLMGKARRYGYER